MNISYPPVASSFVGLDILSGILSILSSWYRITKHITGHFLYVEYSFLSVISYMRDCTKCRKQMYDEVLSVQLYVSSPKPLNGIRQYLLWEVYIKLCGAISFGQ
jgi:hypothetical protein